MFSFEGDYKRRPVQSLSGASKQERTASLLLKNQIERQKREDHRKHVTSALTIQSFYRGHLVRQLQKTDQRNQYDELLVKLKKVGLEFDVTDIFSMMRKLLFFYKDAVDADRLISLCQLVLKYKDGVAASVCRDKNGSYYLLQRLLSLCCRYLGNIAALLSPIALPMRMLELFTKTASYEQHCSSSDLSSNIVNSLMIYLVEKGYFQVMRKLLENRVPSSLESSPIPPTPVAGAILDFIKKPLLVVKAMTNHPANNLILCQFCKDILCSAFSEQVSLFLIPALANDQFPFQQIVHALLPPDSSQMNFGLTVPSSLWLLYAVLKFSQSHLDNLSEVDKGQYILILQQLIPQLPYKKASFVANTATSDDDSDDDCMDVPTDNLGRCSEESLRYIQEAEQVNCIISVVQRENPPPSVVFAICTICHTLMAKHKFVVHRDRLLYTLAFNVPFIRSLWQLCISITTTSVTGAETPLLQLLSRGLSMTTIDRDRIVPVLSLFCSLFCTSIMSLHDAEFFAEDESSHRAAMSFTISELIPISLALRDACLGIIELAHPDTKPSLREDYHKVFKSIGLHSNTVTAEELETQTATWAYVFRVTAQLVKQLYARDSRHPFCPNRHWLSNRVSIFADKPSQIYRAQNSVFVSRQFGALSLLNQSPEEEEGPPLSNTEVRNLTILTELPFVVPFQERVKIFQKLLQNDKDQQQGDRYNFLSGNLINVMIRRNYIYEDAFEKLSPDNEPNLKLKMRVQLVNAAGLDEAGIDGGGIFREFLSELIKTAYDPNRGFFQTTTDQLIYPNPQADVLLENFNQHYYFVGRILGKALYENMLVELPFAGFFLSKILSRHSGDIDVHHLASLDPQVYKNLLYLKNYAGDVAELEIDFTVASSILGETKVEELVPGGSDIPVTNINRIEYIHRVADYRLNRQIRAQSNAFRQGLADVVNLEWLRMFDQHELQILISGAQIPIDLEDLKQHTNYSGGYAADHIVISNFWKVVETFNQKERAQLLKFVTSCSRPPLLGFKDLYPAFCIHFGGNEEDRLPTASTCMNLLKLPEFKDEETMRNKLLYAIESGAGFELS
ncbi:ubiquitin-protein ligase E3C-like [Tubulanus polymorphus]|uniref:ubiquitin-protein ligase E3C-like n=1 Tax=Tubulanus polymorphus TaxID=672921 RepID=UPI003DA45E82